MPTPASISAQGPTTGPSDEQLAVLAKGGDFAARNELIRRFNTTIRMKARGYARAPIPEAALEGEAMRLLLYAADRFDPKAGVKFKTFLETHLRGLYRYTAKHQNVARIPEHQVMEITRYRNVKDILSTNKGREATNGELADALGWSTQQVQKMETSLSRRDIAGSSIEKAHEARRISDRMEDTLEFDYFSRMTPKEKLVYDYSLGKHGKSRLFSVKEISAKTGIPGGEVYAIKSRLAKNIMGRL